MSFKQTVSAVVLALATIVTLPSVGAAVNATIAKGIFWVTTAKGAKMSPGYTFVWAKEGDTAFWFDKGKIVHMMALPHGVATLRQDAAGIYGIVKRRVIGYNWDGTERFNFSGRAVHHDVIASGRGSYFVISRETVAPNVYNDVIVEFDPATNAILWTWSVNDHLLGARDGAQNLGINNEENWGHTNSLDVFDNGDLLISVRNLHKVVRVSYPAGDVIATWGQPGELSFQHHATIQPDGNILVYDNGVDVQQTSIVEFSPTGAIVADRPLDFYAIAMGSVEHLANGNWLVTDPMAGRIIEYTANLSEKVFEAKLANKYWVDFAPGPDKMRSWLYRAHRVSALPPVLP